MVFSIDQYRHLKAYEKALTILTSVLKQAIPLLIFN